MSEDFTTTTMRTNFTWTDGPRHHLRCRYLYSFHYSTSLTETSPVTYMGTGNKGEDGTTGSVTGEGPEEQRSDCHLVGGVKIVCRTGLEESSGAQDCQRVNEQTKSLTDVRRLGDCTIHELLTNCNSESRALSTTLPSVSRDLPMSVDQSLRREVKQSTHQCPFSKSKRPGQRTGHFTPHMCSTEDFGSSFLSVIY